MGSEAAGSAAVVLTGFAGSSETALNVGRRGRRAELSGAGVAGHAGLEVAGSFGAGDGHALEVNIERGVNVLEFVGGLVQSIDLAGAAEGALTLDIGGGIEEWRRACPCT